MMQKKTRSILEELDAIHTEKYADRDRRYIIESRASNVIASAVRLVEQIEAAYPADQAENLVRKLLNAIRMKDAAKFTRTVRRTDADT
jgi:FPC/CPF motif-containing protein YcgG